MRKVSIKYYVLSIMGIVTLYALPFTLYPSYAQSSTCSTVGGKLRAEGLVSSTQIAPGSTFSTTSGACVIDPKAAFAPFKVPSYNDLKSLYFTQSRDTSHKQEISSFPSLNDQMLYHARGSLTIEAPVAYSGTSLVFIDGSLTINGNITGSNTGGLLFVVGGDVNIHYQNVDRIDAVIISSGTICTAFDGSSCPPGNIETPRALTINGSLISIDETEPIKFRRSLPDNTLAAEKINHQVKYLVILRNTLSDTLQKWSEIQ
ncbi:MAG: Uncharacterized protein G01um10147_327 [Microgenomates group bacterium Gr01-1014_7]|nr:MAG: Uncharacterized protein G01um10147_327 [Microgenomates group bacterium Gr01-1014_7]